MARTLCECGRPAVALPGRGSRRRSRKARRGVPVALKGHDLCPRCHEAAMDRFYTASKPDRAIAAETPAVPDAVPPVSEIPPRPAAEN